jgi:hypothetical protein
MAFKRDDDNLALAVKALCDAFEHEDAMERALFVLSARQYADSVLNRGKKKDKPAKPVEGETSGRA